eukprot:6762459-Pyramimonas_sp.AAC.1
MADDSPPLQSARRRRRRRQRSSRLSKLAQRPELASASDPQDAMYIDWINAWFSAGDPQELRSHLRPSIRREYCLSLGARPWRASSETHPV